MMTSWDRKAKTKTGPQQQQQQQQQHSALIIQPNHTT